MVVRAGELPEELLLAPLQYCELETWVSFALTCKLFSRWFENRIFWISALKSTKRLRPIACPFHQDLSKCSLEELREIGHRTLRLERNWSLPRPKMMRPLRSIALSQRNLDAIFQVPGTGLYLMHSRREGSLFCIDAQEGKQVAGPLYAAPWILDVSPGQDDPGRYSMGLLLSGWDHASIAIVCLEYDLGVGGEVKLSYIFQHALDQGPRHWAIFMTRELVGVMVNPALNLGEDCLEILAYNIASRERTLIQTDIAVPIDEHVRSGTSIYDDDLFFLVEYGNESRLYRCPRSLLPTDDKLVHPKTQQLKDTDLKYCNRTSWGSKSNQIGLGTFANSYPEGALSADPHYGVPAVSIHRHVLPLGEDEMDAEDGRDQEPVRSRMEVRFWTSSKDETGNSSHARGSSEASTTHDQPTLIPHSSGYVQGIVQDTATVGGAWVLMLIPPSGRMATMILNVGGGQSPILSLIRFNTEKKECTTHTLELPGDVSMSDIYGLTVDDNCGQVSLLDTDGSMHIVSYS